MTELEERFPNVRDWYENGLDQEAFEVLFDYYCFELHEMPYGTAKARTGDPYNWIADRLEEELG